jgi:hypothetical protein
MKTLTYILAAALVINGLSACGSGVGSSVTQNQGGGITLENQSVNSCLPNTNCIWVASNNCLGITPGQSCTINLTTTIVPGSGAVLTLPTVTSPYAMSGDEACHTTSSTSCTLTITNNGALAATRLPFTLSVWSGGQDKTVIMSITVGGSLDMLESNAGYYSTIHR